MPANGTANAIVNLFKTLPQENCGPSMIQDVMKNMPQMVELLFASYEVNVVTTEMVNSCLRSVFRMMRLITPLQIARCDKDSLLQNVEQIIKVATEKKPISEIDLQETILRQDKIDFTQCFMTLLLKELVSHCMVLKSWINSGRGFQNYRLHGWSYSPGEEKITIDTSAFITDLKEPAIDNVADDDVICRHQGSKELRSKCRKMLKKMIKLRVDNIEVEQRCVKKLLRTVSDLLEIAVQTFSRFGMDNKFFKLFDVSLLQNICHLLFSINTLDISQQKPSVKMVLKNIASNSFYINNRFLYTYHDISKVIIQRAQELSFIAQSQFPNYNLASCGRMMHINRFELPVLRRNKHDKNLWKDKFSKASTIDAIKAMAPDGNCPICLENLGDKTIGILSDCIHIFCYSCIHTWIWTKQNNNNCPGCRTKSRDYMSSDMVPIYAKLCNENQV